MKKNRNLARIAALTISIAAAASVGVHAQSLGECLSVQVPLPVVMPDGSTHDPGTLRLCFSRSYSPVSGLHETSVNGDRVGLLVSRKGSSEGEASPDPYVVFERTGSDELRLLAYAWPDGRRMNTYRLAGRDLPRRQLARKGTSAGAGAAAARASLVLLVAHTD